MIKPIGFIELSAFTAHYIVKYRERMADGILTLRATDALGDAHDLPILKEWKSGRAVLARIQSGAAPFLGGKTPELGRAWIEMLPGGHGQPWLQEEDEYAQTVIRTRTCMVPTHDAYSYSGNFRELLNVGVLNVIEHRILHSETNFSAYPRVHLIVDIKKPDADQE